MGRECGFSQSKNVVFVFLFENISLLRARSPSSLGVVFGFLVSRPLGFFSVLEIFPGAKKSRLFFLPTRPKSCLPTFTNYYQQRQFALGEGFVVVSSTALSCTSSSAAVPVSKKQKTSHQNKFFDHEVRITNFYQLLPTELVTFLCWIL